MISDKPRPIVNSLGVCCWCQKMASSNLRQTLKALYADLVKGLDPESASEFFSDGLLTNTERESVDAGATRTKKNRNLMDALLRRDSEKSLHKIIQVLEGEEGEDKVANEVLLRKIGESQSVLISISFLKPFLLLSSH